MNRLRWLAYAAILMSFALTMVGCGGGGGGTAPGGNQGVKRSLNVVQGTNDLGTIQVGSRFSKTLTARWVSVASPSQDLGKATISNVDKLEGSGTVTLNSDGTVTLINDLPSDTFKLRFTVAHDTADDPDFGKTETGIQTVLVTPEQPRIVQPGGTSVVAQGGALNFIVQAQNGRSSAYQLIQIPKQATSRAYVNVPATLAFTPANSAQYTVSDGTYAVTFNPAFSGSVTITATITGTSVTATTNVSVIPHPTVVITTPTEGQTVSGSISVSFATANGVADYSVDGNTPTNVNGTSFALDTTTLANGAHSVTVRAVGQLETASLTRNFVVNNATGGGRTDGKLTRDSSLDFSVPSGTTWVGVLKDGRRAVLVSGTTLKIFDQSNVLVKTFTDVSALARTCAITDDQKVVVPSQSGFVAIVDPTTSAVSRISGTGFTEAVCSMPGTNKFLIASADQGILVGDLQTMTSSQLWTTNAADIGYDGENIIYTEDATGDIFSRSITTAQVKFRIPKPGNIFSLGVSRKSNAFVAVVNDGSAAGINQWDLKGQPIPNSHIPQPVSGSWFGIGENQNPTTEAICIPSSHSLAAGFTYH